MTSEKAHDRAEISGMSHPDAGVPYSCKRCRESLSEGQSECPFCEQAATPIDEIADERSMTREDFESLKRGLKQAKAHMKGEDVECRVHRFPAQSQSGDS